MKIGSMIQKYGVSRETLRYYIKIGLLNPISNNGQYDFTIREEEDLEDILRLKSMRFKLEEIQPILNWKKFSIGMESSLKAKYITALQAKEKELLDQSKELERSIKDIQSEMEHMLYSEHTSTTKMGVPLMALPKLVCPHCGKHLEFSGAQFDYRYLYQGELKCSCGYCAKIKDGVICTGNRDDGDDDRPDLKREVYELIDKNLVRAHQLCTNKVIKQLEIIDIQGKVIMEGNINGYFFLYNWINNLNPDCLYIFVDKYEEVLLMYRELLEQAGVKANILFIADADNELPLEQGCVDILLNFFAENEWSLYHDYTYLEASRKYLKKNAWILGSHDSFPAASKSRKCLRKNYPRSSPHAYNIDYLIQDYKKQGVELTVEKMVEFHHTDIGYSLSCHQSGEPLLIYYIQANA